MKRILTLLTLLLAPLATLRAAEAPKPNVLLILADDLGIAENTLILFLADNGTDADLVNTWGK